MYLLWPINRDLEFQIKSYFHFATVITRSHFPSGQKIFFQNYKDLIVNI